MRPYTSLLLLGLILGTASSARAADAVGGKPKGVDQMSVEELREEARRLCTDDVPYAKYVRAILQAADEAWPKLKESEQYPFKVHVYWQVVDALRLLTGAFVLPKHFQDVPFDPKYSAAMELAGALEKLKLNEQSRAFYKDVFASDSFQKSGSKYRDAVIDLWRRYEKTGRAMPYSILLALNQPGMGHPRGSTLWTNELRLGHLYEQLGEHATAAEWYAKVPPEGLGPLKAADASFAAAQYDVAAERYEKVLGQLDEWATRLPRLQASALAEPLESANLQEIRKHAESRLNEIKRLKAVAGGAKGAAGAATKANP
jgi:hypothetical protein